MNGKQDKDTDKILTDSADHMSTDEEDWKQVLSEWATRYDKEKERRKEAERRYSNEKLALHKILSFFKSKIDEFNEFYSLLNSEFKDGDYRSHTTTTTTTTTRATNKGTPALATHGQISPATQSSSAPTSSKKKAPRKVPSDAEPVGAPVMQRLANETATKSPQQSGNDTVNTTTVPQHLGQNGNETTSTTTVTPHVGQNGNGSYASEDTRKVSTEGRDRPERSISPDFPRRSSAGSVTTVTSEISKGLASRSLSEKKTQKTPSTSEKDGVSAYDADPPSKQSVREFIEEEKKTIVELLTNLPRTSESDVLKTELEEGSSTYRISGAMKKEHKLIKGVHRTQTRNKKQNYNISLHGVKLSSANLNCDPHSTNFEDPRNVERALVEIQKLFDSYLQKQRIQETGSLAAEKVIMPVRKDKASEDIVGQEEEPPASKQKRLRTEPSKEEDGNQPSNTNRSPQRQSAKKAIEKLAEMNKVREYNVDELEVEHVRNRPVSLRDTAAREKLQEGTITQKMVSYRKNPDNWQLREIDTCNLNLSQVRLKPVDGTEAPEPVNPDDVYLLEDIGGREGKSACMNCGEVKLDEDRTLMKCKGCGCAYHYTCHWDIDGSLDPSAHWVCDFCRKETRTGKDGEEKTSDTEGCGPRVKFKNKKKRQRSKIYDDTDESEEEEDELSDEDEEELKIDEENELDEEEEKDKLTLEEDDELE